MTHDGDVRVPLGPSPAVAWAAAAWIGALAGWEVVDATAQVDPRRGGWHALVLAGLCAAVAAIGWRPRRVRGPGQVGLALTLVGIVLVAAAGCGLAMQRRTALAAGPLVALARDGGTASIVAEVASEPVVRDDGTAWALVTVTQLDGMQGKWRALVSGQRAPPAVGATVRMQATARPLGDDDFDGYLRRRHAVVALDAVDVTLLRHPAGLLAAVERVRARTREAAGDGLGGDAAGLAVGLVTGDTRQLGQAAQDQMQASGLTHLVAVSGSNVALVAGVVASLVAPLGARLRRVAVVLAVVAFTVTTRAEPSVLRAAVMATMVLAAVAVGRPRVGLHALAVAVIMLLLLDPASAGSLGLALSVTATLGVLVVAPVVVGRLPDRIPGPVAGLVAATLGAQAAVAPVLLAGIGDVPLAAVPANLVAVPAAAVASLVAVVAAVVAQVDIAAGATMAGLAGPALRLVLAVAARAGGGPVLSLAAPLGVAAAVVAMAALLARPRSRLRRACVVVVAAGMAATALGGRGGAWSPPSVLAVTAIDVGQGDALLVTTASGHRMLVDTGRDGRAADWLRSHGIRGLDLVIVTHGDQDHVGGLPDVLGVAEVPVLWVAPTPEGAPDAPWAADGGAVGPDAELSPSPVAAGATARLGSAVVEVLGPPGGWDLVATEGGRNDRSVVVRVTEGDRVALLPGDAEHAAQRWLLANVADLQADLLVVPHHGAATSEPAFLEAVAPGVAIVSVGADNDYGHPRPEVLDVLSSTGTVVHRTDAQGTVTLVVPP